MSKRVELTGYKKPNLCCTFVLPMCEINYRSFPSNFINSYLNYEDQILVVFENQPNNRPFNLFMEYIQSNKNFKESIEEADEIILVFNIPERNKENYNLFLDGKYSKFTKEYKALLCSYYGMQSEKNTYKVTEYNTINPEKFKRQQIADRLGVNISEIEEVMDKPDPNKEQYKSIIQIIQQFNTTNQYDNKQQDSFEHNNIQ